MMHAAVWWVMAVAVAGVALMAAGVGPVAAAPAVVDRNPPAEADEDPSRQLREQLAKLKALRGRLQGMSDVSAGGQWGPPLCLAL
jgi:hypothetical protein